MNAKMLVVGFVLGAAVFGAVLVGTGALEPNVDADAVCNNRLDDGNWSGEQITTDAFGGTATVECTRNGTTETIGVSVDVEVQS